MDLSTWRKSSFSDDQGGECVEVRIVDDMIELRESDRPRESILTSREKFQAFLDGVKAGEFDDYGVSRESAPLSR